MLPVFSEIGLVFGLAVWGGILARAVGMPALVGNVLVGLVVKNWLGHSWDLTAVFSALGSVGVMLLLFLAGLEFKMDEFRRVGKQVMVIAFSQIVIFGLLTCLLFWKVLGLSLDNSLLLAWIITFSSTVVVVKMLSEKRDTVSLVGRLSLGVLLVQDLWAIALLMFLPDWGVRGDMNHLLLTFGRLVGLLFAVLVVGQRLAGWLASKLAKNSEEALLFGLAWCFTLVGLSVSLGLSAEMGGFLAGISLSMSWQHHQISTRVKSVRDFFLTIFFVILGYSINISKIDWVLVLVVSLWCVIGKLVFVWWGARLAKIRQRVAFLTGINLTQLSEFSLIALTLALSKNLLSEAVVASVSLVAIVTIGISVYLIGKGKFLFVAWEKMLGFLWPDHEGKEEFKKDRSGHIVLIGCHRMGRSILSQLDKMKEKVVVVDFDPELMENLRRTRSDVIYADISDDEIYEMANLKTAKLIISTVKDVEDSLALLTGLRQRGWNTPVIVDAESVEEAERLYQHGAVYVVFPHFLGGWHMGQVLRKLAMGKNALKMYKKKQVDLINKVYEI